MPLTQDQKLVGGAAVGGAVAVGVALTASSYGGTAIGVMYVCMGR